ncbi:MULTISPECIES: GNAT family N-acetyltransferase [Pseudomonadaceae]|uniref:GNAT family N-acetyltransferase n=1 Tax=Pseudomonadaceae TaxID=135621 RepID=UPI00103C2A61|nr:MULTISPECIES: GNAT family N-acetyltransferase [Pseudomonadaceae]MBA1279633.1 N-acetyltransferase [Stutzerimonas stutzeri]MBC8649610.1 N-acetyltransferase [Pseudomonas sp. MT4]QXY90935.1 N-acetyltransferase [Pseudomonas sp. MTM4]TCD19135.1 N-acetyltransferase [Pseudomonas sp. IC_126]
MSDNNAKVRHDKDQQRYLLDIEGETLGFAAYREDGDSLVFTHTEVDPSLEGQGMGSVLIRQSLDDARQRSKRIVPVCGFVAAYVKKHPDWNDIIDSPAQ